MKLRVPPNGRAGFAADIGLAAVFAAALAFQAVQIAESWGGGHWRFGCAAGAVVCVLALSRRRHRTLAAFAGLIVAAAAILTARSARLPAEPSPAMALGLAVLVGSGVRALPAAAACAVAAGGLAVVAGGLFAALTSSSNMTVPLLNGMGWLAALVIGLWPRLLDARRRAVSERVRRGERMELARELHDLVAHHITGIVVQAQAARLVAGKHPEKLDDSLAAIETAGSDALAAMRRVVGLLRDTAEDDAAPAAPGPERLGELVGRFDDRGGPAVHARLPDDEEQSAWPPEVAGTVYRVVQESLTNIARHAPHAPTVTVSVTRDRQAITVEVVDDAPPSPALYPQRGGYGLVGMRERVEALGGTLCAGPRTATGAGGAADGAGWSVRATLPVRERESR